MTLSLQRPGGRMSPTAKSWLSDTVRILRARLLKDLNDGLDSTYRLGIPASRADLDEERPQKRRRLEEWLDEQSRGNNRGQKALDIVVKTLATFLTVADPTK